jgi:hypothetical protein
MWDKRRVEPRGLQVSLGGKGSRLAREAMDAERTSQGSGRRGYDEPKCKDGWNWELGSICFNTVLTASGILPRPVLCTGAQLSMWSESEAALKQHHLCSVDTKHMG